MRSKIILILAILMGFVTTVLFFNFMKQFESEQASSESLIEIVVAKQPIQKNQRITSSMVELAKVPRTGLQEQTLSRLSDIEGKFAAADMAAGEQLLAHRLLTAKEETVFISRKVRDGYRAVSVGVNFVQSVSNLIEPGDVVDVVFTNTDKTEGPIVSNLILSNVPVLAVGRRMIEAADEKAYAEYSSATLELVPPDAVTLINAYEKGSVSLILHGKLIPGASEDGGG